MTHIGVSLLTLVVLAQTSDPYEAYVRTSKDFQPVKQSRAWSDAAFPPWTYMPWTYQWSIGYTPESARWARSHGYVGAFLDGLTPGLDDADRKKLAWINQNHFPFYTDHLAGKRRLHLWDRDPDLNALHAPGLRPVPLNADLAQTLRDHIQRNIDALRSSPQRAAYALDDEPSWGHFVHPAMWQITDDPTAYPAWLREVYGADKSPKRDRWVTYDDIRPNLPNWTIRDFDASPLMDQWSFNDSLWLNFIGDLVSDSNTLDPHTPCGIVGGQAPNAFGGYDYAKLIRKVQFLESYNLGSSQAIIRSLNPSGAVVSVTTHFHHAVADTTWQTWYYLAHGNRGFIGWVENWFDGQTPRDWHEKVAPHLVEAASKIGPLMKDATWIHDGVAIYYSHPSIQLGWILDAQAHGKTWVNRNNDHRLGTSHHVRHAWENMLRDSGLQYNFLSYADVIQSGIPPEYKVLILPACLALSDAECQRIMDFCRNGGTVIADDLPALWDQHGRGRPHGGALDSLFGVKHPPDLKGSDVFGPDDLWCEVDQDANFGWKSYQEFLTNKNTSTRGPEGYDIAVPSLPVATSHPFGQGTAVLLNLSPQWYNAFRADGFAASQKRQTFMTPILARTQPWVRLENAAEPEHGYEITYWQTPDRTLIFLCQNPEVEGSQTGGGNAAALRTDRLNVVLAFSHDVTDLRDERTGATLGTGRRFPLPWTMNEALVLSFQRPGAP
jgi:hypothetical protein